MAIDEKNAAGIDPVEEIDEEWEALDAAAEVHEQEVFEEIAAARVARAKMEATAAKRQEALDAQAKKEAEEAEAAAKRAASDEELTEEEVLKRRATIAAKDGVQLRNTQRMAIFFTALGAVEVIFGIMRSNMIMAVIGGALFVLCAVYLAKLRPRYKAAVEHFNILSAELDEYYVKNPKEEPPAEPEQSK